MNIKNIQCDHICIRDCFNTTIDLPELAQIVEFQSSELESFTLPNQTTKLIVNSLNELTEMKTNNCLKEIVMFQCRQLTRIELPTTVTNIKMMRPMLRHIVNLDYFKEINAVK